MFNEYNTSTELRRCSTDNGSYSNRCQNLAYEGVSFKKGQYKMMMGQQITNIRDISTTYTKYNKYKQKKSAMEKSPILFSPLHQNKYTPKKITQQPRLWDENKNDNNNFVSHKLNNDIEVSPFQKYKSHHKRKLSNQFMQQFEYAKVRNKQIGSQINKINIRQKININSQKQQQNQIIRTDLYTNRNYQYLNKANQQKNERYQPTINKEQIKQSSKEINIQYKKKNIKQQQNRDYQSRSPIRAITPPRNMGNNQIIEKYELLKNKIGRLEKLTPIKKKQASIKSIEFYRLYDESLNNSPLCITQQVHDASDRIYTQRQKQIIEKSGLQRLVQQKQEDCDNQIQIIQDLSHRISSKLESIIRNYSRLSS